jgi:uncharacterized protein with beta-barrel porin domain
LDYRIAPGTVVGFALAGAGTGWSLAQGLGSGRSDAFQAGVYGTTRYGPAYLAAALAYTEHWMSTDRYAFAGDYLTANFNAQSFGGRAEAGCRVPVALWALPSLIPGFEALPGASFIVNGATPAKNSALTSAGAELRLINGFSVLAKFDGEFASHSQTYAGTGTVRFTW